jgi:citrate lyase subunit beta/citryl-CoA lyase
MLYMPADNARAVAKIPTLACDAVVLDLEDAVAPDAKAAAREAAVALLKARGAQAPEIIVRINGLRTEWGADDLAAIGAAEPDGILLPKVETPRDILEVGDTLDDQAVADAVRLWAMIETTRAVLNIGAIAELGRDPASRLAGFVVGTNDLALETGVAVTADRRHLVPWLMQIVLAARAGHLVVLDGVMNDFRDAGAFAGECAEAAAMGFDGKTLIHPSQVEPANAAFAPSAEAVARAQAVVDAFGLPENAGKGVIAIDGRMVERLHLTQAERLLARASGLQTGKGKDR